MLTARKRPINPGVSARRVTHATRAPHDFKVPPDFDLAAYRDRPAWRLARPRGTARIRVSPALAWWVEAHWSHCGAVTRTDDGGILYETEYADERPLLSWVLGLAGDAELLGPPELRASLHAQLERLRLLLDEPSPAGGGRPARPAAGGRRRRTTDDWHVDVDRFTRLTALMSYLLARCGPGPTTIDAADVRSALGVDARELREDVRLLNLVNFAGGGNVIYIRYEGSARLVVECEPEGVALRRPARLSPLQADTLLLAVELVGGQLPTASGEALRSAAAKLRAARAGGPALAGGDLIVPDDDVLGAVNAAVARRHVLQIDYWTEGTDRFTTRVVEPYLLVHNRSEWYFVCWCRTAGGTRVFRVATTRSVETLGETFEPRPEVELEVYRREGIPTSGSYAPHTATVWYSPTVARWIAERETVRELDDGSCLASQPYVDEGWLARHLLRFADQARPLAPPAAVAGVRAAVDDLLERYR